MPAATRTLLRCRVVLRPRGQAPFLAAASDSAAAAWRYELDISESEAALLMRMSAATIDRRLAPEGEDHAARAFAYEAGHAVEVAGVSAPRKVDQERSAGSRSNRSTSEVGVGGQEKCPLVDFTRCATALIEY